jgi:hypothetical protein
MMIIKVLWTMMMLWWHGCIFISISSKVVSPTSASRA